MQVLWKQLHQHAAGRVGSTDAVLFSLNFYEFNDRHPWPADTRQTKVSSCSMWWMVKLTGMDFSIRISGPWALFWHKRCMFTVVGRQLSRCRGWPMTSFFFAVLSRCTLNITFVVVSIFFNFHPYLGKMNPFWRAYFSTGVETTN